MRSLANFLRVWGWFSLRLFRLRFWRVLAVLLGLGLGAAVFTSVRLAVTASLDSVNRSLTAMTGKAEWRVIRPGGLMDDALTARLLRLPAVRAASPVLSTHVRTPSGEPVLLLGLDPILDRSLREWEGGTSEGSGEAEGAMWSDLMARPWSVALGSEAARRLGVAPGGRVVLTSVSNTVGREFTVLGVLRSRGLARAEGGLMALADIATVQEFLGTPGLVDRIDLILRPEASEGDLEAVRNLLPAGTVLVRASEAKDSGLAMVRAYETNLTILSFVALFVGMFLVYSLVALNAASRRGELAVLRALGASPRLIFLVFLADGGLLGLLGWLMAIPAGALMVRGLLTGVSSTVSDLFVQVPAADMRLHPAELGLSLALTVGVSIVAALQPARAAMAVEPAEALSSSPGPTGGSARGYAKRRWRLVATAILLLAPVMPLASLPGPQGLPLPGYAAVFLLFLGFSLLAPPLLSLMGRVLPPLLARVGGTPAFLAGRYVRASGIRASISVGALVTAMGLFVALAVMVHSFRDTFGLWVRESISGDLFIRAVGAEANEYKEPLPRQAQSWLQERAGEEGLDVLGYVRIYLRYPVPGRPPVLCQFEPVDTEVYVRHARLLFLRPPPGGEEATVSAFQDGQGVIVSETFSNLTGLAEGDRFRTEAGGVRLDLPILGVIRSYRTKGGLVLSSLAKYQAETGDFAWSGARVYFLDRRDRAGLDAGTRELREALLSRWGESLEVIPGEALRQEMLRIFNETFAVTTVLLVIALAVAALGITTTLAVLVLERTRQIHTLMAVGASPGQIRAAIAWEAVLLVAAGELLGLACGLVLSDILVFDINRLSFGWTFAYSLDWPAILLSVPLVLATALGAALPAVHLAFASPPAEVLRER